MAFAKDDIKLHVKRNSNGVFYVRPYLGCDIITGKQIKPYREFPDAKSEQEALQQAYDWLSVHSASLSLKINFDLESNLYWALEVSKQAWAYNTYRSYKTRIKRWVVPYLGDQDIKSIKPYIFEKLYLYLIDEKHLCAGTVVAVHKTLSRLFNVLVDNDVVAYNPLSVIKSPRNPKKEAVAICNSDLSKLVDVLLETIEGQNMQRARRDTAICAWVALNTGLRIGEVCGLRKMDLNVQLKRLEVRGTVVRVPKDGCIRQECAKTSSSVRNVAIDDELVDLLKHNENMSAFGSVALIAAPHNKFQCPETISKYFKKICREIGLPESVTFHSLRHTHATMLIAAKTDYKQMMQRLGHSDVRVTLGTYTHAEDSRDQTIANEFSKMIKEMRR